MVYHNSFVGDSRNNTLMEEQKQLALLVMETLTVLLQGSNTNAGISEMTDETYAASYRNIWP